MVGRGPRRNLCNNLIACPIQHQKSVYASLREKDLLPVRTEVQCARRVVTNVQRVLAIELMCAAQGLDYRAPLKPGRGALRAHQLVRSMVRPLDADRVLTPDIEMLADAVASGKFGEEMVT